MTQLTDIQRQILLLIKQHGETTIERIAAELTVSYEAVRQQLRKIVASGLVIARLHRQNDVHAGRPTTMYRLSLFGEHAFPKSYDELAVEMVDKVAELLGPDALRRVLMAFTDEKVEQWSAKMAGKSLADRLEALKDLYFKDDPHTEVDTSSNGVRLIERNCPFLNVATRRPALCSVTVSTLSRLLGFRVTREERFQHGDGRCAFVVHTDRPIDPEQFRFEFEEDAFSITFGDDRAPDGKQSMKWSKPST